MSVRVTDCNPDQKERQSGEIRIYVFPFHLNFQVQLFINKRCTFLIKQSWIFICRILNR